MKMDYEELEARIKEEKTRLATLEEMYDHEEDENRASKLEYRISRQDEKLNRLIDRQDAIADKEEEDEQEDEPKDKNMDDDSVCPVCGSDLYDEGDGIFVCEKCNEFYEMEEEE